MHFNYAYFVVKLICGKQFNLQTTTSHIIPVFLFANRIINQINIYPESQKCRSLRKSKFHILEHPLIKLVFKMFQISHIPFCAL